MAWSKRELVKIVKVSDPWNWYGENEIQVKLFCLLPRKGCNYASEIRVLASSIDDFMMCIDICVQRDSQQCVDNTYSYAKNYIFDAIPEEVNCQWLFDHGFWVF